MIENYKVIEMIECRPPVINGNRSINEYVI
jgi:hypothetical protein